MFKKRMTVISIARLCRLLPKGRKNLSIIIITRELRIITGISFKKKNNPFVIRIKINYERSATKETLATIGTQEFVSRKKQSIRFKKNKEFVSESNNLAENVYLCTQKV